MRNKYIHEKNQHLEVIDLRDNEWRREKFIRHLRWRSWAKELDDQHWNSYFIESDLHGNPLTDQQKVWFGMLYGLTYSPCLAWTFLHHFPNLEALTEESVSDWMKEHSKRLIWKFEARHTRQHVPEIFDSVRKWAAGDIYAKVMTHASDDKHEWFNSLFADMTKNLYGFGRFTAWTAIQCLVESVGIPMEPNTMFVDGSSSTRNQWRGVCQYDNLMQYAPKGTHTFMKECEPAVIDKKVIDHVAGRSVEILDELRSILHDVPLTMLNLESMLCEWAHDFMDFHPGIHGIDITGVYPVFREAFPEVDYSPMKRAIDAVPSVIRAFEPVLPRVFPIIQTGQLFHLNELYDDMPDMYAEVGIEPEFFRMKEVDGDYVMNGDRTKRLRFAEQKFKDYCQNWNNRGLW